ncbi:MAG: hypothetical protein QOH42_949 [Blastocatellia bacterium]|nr:hypothetical protein [Blastocatellia bacterium]
MTRPDEASTGSGSDRVSTFQMARDRERETRSLPLPVLTSHLPKTLTRKAALVENLPSSHSEAVEIAAGLKT